MEIDLKAVSVALGIASSAVALAYRLKPNPASRLKRDLELLKLARETQANYFALQRHVDAQMQGQYVVRSLSRQKKFDLYFKELCFWPLFGAIIFGFIGSLVALAAKAVFSADDKTTAAIIIVGGALGLMSGISIGATKGSEQVRTTEQEVESKADEIISSDEAAISEIRKKDA